MARDAALHIQKSLTRKPNFSGPTRFKFHNFAALAKRLRHTRQIQNRSNLVPHENDRNT